MAPPPAASYPATQRTYLHQQAAIVELADHDVHVGAAQVQAQALGALPHRLDRILDAWERWGLIEGK